MPKTSIIKRFKGVWSAVGDLCVKGGGWQLSRSGVYLDYLYCRAALSD
jgi:hypothetical protein